MPKYDDFMDIATILDDYSKNIYEEMEKASVDVADKGVSTLKLTSPKSNKKGKHYRSCWRVKTTSNLNRFSSTIYNTQYQLTHLLEKGHKINRNGQQVGVAGAKVHIRPVELQCINEYEQDVVNIIKKGA